MGPVDDSLVTDSVTALIDVLAAKENAVERAGQVRMVEAVAAALSRRSHLVVEAGTGTGKSLAYLIPAVLSGARVAVATATKSLQNQLADVELPFLDSQLPVPVTWSVVKGRGSYACMAKLVERFGEDLDGDGIAELFADDGAGLDPIVEWIREGGSGDRDDLPVAVDDDIWRQVSVSGMECPGKARCPQGRSCFAEAAFEAARDSQLTITNHHLYALHLASERRILPEHDAVIFDEAHKLEAASSAAFGVDVSGRRVTAFANNIQRLLSPAIRDERIRELRVSADQLGEVVRRLPEARLDPAAGDPGDAILGAIQAVARADRALPKVKEEDPRSGAIARVRNQGGHLQGDFGMALDLPDGYVAWAEPPRGVIRVAPIAVDASIASNLLVHSPAILTSATLTTGGSFGPLAARIGLTARPLADDPAAFDVEDPLPRTYDELRLDGGFEFASQGLLYTASDLPDPRDDEWAGAAAEEARLLVEAAGAGRWC